MSPAISVTSRNAGTADLGLYTSTSQLKRSSGTLTRAELGSIVQNGKFSAGIAQPEMVLKSVDLPTCERDGNGRRRVSDA